MVDYHLIMDMVPAISRLYFLNQLGDLALSATQSVGYLLLAWSMDGWWVGPFDVISGLLMEWVRKPGLQRQEACVAMRLASWGAIAAPHVLPLQRCLSPTAAIKQCLSGNTVGFNGQSLAWGHRSSFSIL